MVFSSSIFVFLFLPLVLLFYFLVPKKLKNYVLLVFSIIFYLFGGPKFLIALFLIVLINYFGAIGIDKTNRKKLFLTLTIACSLLVLCYFKYTNFFITNIDNIFNLNIKTLDIILPIGISFYTFQALSYSIDVYRKKVSLQKNFLTLLLYVSLFPQLVAGPIVRYETIEKQLTNRNTTLDDFVYGIKRFILGLAKKVIIANQMGLLADTLFTTNEISMPLAWLAAIAYMFQIYFDFSAYSDMAIGLGRIFGFKFLENFNFPYISKSITEFWRRWHISLSTWFRDYVYIPLGGNKKGVRRQIINLLIVWALTGFWHGAAWNFVIWGLYYFVFLILEKFVLKKLFKNIPSFFKHFYALFIILMGWVIFRCDNLALLTNMFSSMFTFDFNNLDIKELIVYLETYYPYLILSILFSCPIYYKITDKIEKMKDSKKKTFFNVLHYGFILGLFIITIMFLAHSTYNPFIYFRF